MSIFAFKLEWLYQLECLHQLGSVNQAAEHCQLTAPALRHNLRQLENYCGETLLISDKRGLQLNPHGLELLQRSQILLHQLGQLQQQFKQPLTAPVLKIGVSNAYPSETLSEILAELYLHFPGLQIQTQTGTPPEILRLLSSGHIELGLISARYTPDERIKALKGPISTGLFVQSAHQPVPKVYLLPLLWPYSFSTPFRYPDFSAELKIHYIGGLSSLLQLCLAGAGIAFLPRLHVQAALNSGKLIEATGPEMPAFKAQLTLLYPASPPLSPPAEHLFKWWKERFVQKG